MKFLRYANNLTLDEIAFRIDVDRGTLSRLERGLLKPSDEVRQRVESFWKTPLEQLLQEVTFDEMQEHPIHLSPTYIREAASDLADAKDTYEYVSES